MRYESGFIISLIISTKNPSFGCYGRRLEREGAKEIENTKGGLAIVLREFSIYDNIL